jgi:hypothetical protein
MLLAYSPNRTSVSSTSRVSSIGVDKPHRWICTRRAQEGDFRRLIDDRDSGARVARDAVSRVAKDEDRLKLRDLFSDLEQSEMFAFQSEYSRAIGELSDRFVAVEL